MSFWDRIGRAFEALDDQAHYGLEAVVQSGLASGRRSLQDGGYHAWFDPIVPGRDGSPFSVPAVVFAEGSLFCVDIRRWRGSLSFSPITEEVVVPVQKRFLFWTYDGQEVQKRTVGFDRSKIVQEKEGNYGEDVFYKTHRHPLGKPKAFIHALKDHLGRKEARWQRLRIYPVASFHGEEVDLGEVHSLEDGVISLNDFPRLAEYRRNQRFLHPSSWILAGLNALPTWDRLITRKDEVFQGAIREATLGITTAKGDDLLRLSEIDRIDFTRGTFSERDEVVAHYRDGRELIGWISGRSLTIVDERRCVSEHKIRNLSKVLVGISASDGWTKR